MKRKNVIRMKWMLAGVAAYFFSATVGAQQPFVMQDPILEHMGIKYAETGVAESKDDPRWKQAPLLLEFATTASELYSDINVTIKDTSQKTVFQKKINSPWLVIWLKPGTYYVYLTNKHGVTKSATMRRKR